jgi:hypothetical protein
MMFAGTWIVPTAPWYEKVYVPGPVRRAGDAARLVGRTDGGLTAELLGATDTAGGGAPLGVADGALMTHPALTTDIPTVATTLVRSPA